MFRLNKYFNADGTAGGKTTGSVEEEDLLIEDGIEGNTEISDDEIEETSGNTENDSDDLDGSEPDYDKELDRLRAKVASGSETDPKDKTKDGETAGDEDNLLNENKADEGKTSKGVVTITEDYIKSQPEEHQAILRGVLGKQKSIQTNAQLLKNYVHGQLRLKELEEGGKQPASEQRESAADSSATFQPENADDDSIETAANQYLVDMLRAKYPNVTTDDLKDEDSIEEFVAEMQTHSPVKASRFMREYDKVRELVNDRKAQFTHIAKNWKQIDKAIVVDTVKQFDGFLKKAGLKSDDLGLKYTEKFILENFISPQGKIDPKIVTYMDKDGNIPIVNGGALLMKMKNHYEDLIMEKVRSRGRVEGIEQRTKSEPPGSISGGSHRQRGERDKPVETMITDDMTDEEMSKVLEAQKKRIREKYKTGD